MIRTQRELRRAFWAWHPHLPRCRIKNYSGNGLMYPTDTRVAFCEWLDSLCRTREISEDLAQRATLDD